MFLLKTYTLSFDLSLVHMFRNTIVPFDFEIECILYLLINNCVYEKIILHVKNLLRILSPRIKTQYAAAFLFSRRFVKWMCLQCQDKLNDR